MSTSIFSTSFDSYSVSHIIYVGAVQEIAEEKRKNDMTHFFRIITRLGPAYCYFKGADSVRKARAMLETMIDSIKPRIFRSANELIDVDSVISYGRIVKLKNIEDGKTHAFTVSLDTVSEKHSQIWLAYKTEESAKKSRAVLWSIMESSFNKTYKQPADEKVEVTVAECAVEIEN